MSQLCDSAKQCTLAGDEDLLSALPPTSQGDNTEEQRRRVLERSYRAHLRLLALLFPAVGLTSAMLLDGPVMLSMASEGEDPLAWSNWGAGGRTFVRISSHLEDLEATVLAMVGAFDGGSFLKGFRFSALSSDINVQDAIANLLECTPVNQVKSAKDLIGLLRESRTDTGIEPDTLDQVECAWGRLFEAARDGRLPVSRFGPSPFREWLQHALYTEPCSVLKTDSAHQWIHALVLHHAGLGPTAPRDVLEERSKFLPRLKMAVHDPEDQRTIAGYYERAYLRAIALQNQANFLSFVPHDEVPGGEAQLFDWIESLTPSNRLKHGGLGRVIDLPAYFMEYVAGAESACFTALQWQAREAWLESGDLRDLELFLQPLVQDAMKANLRDPERVLEAFEASMTSTEVSYERGRVKRNIQGSINDVSTERTRKILELFSSFPSRNNP